MIAKIWWSHWRIKNVGYFTNLKVPALFAAFRICWSSKTLFESAFKENTRYLKFSYSETRMGNQTIFQPLSSSYRMEVEASKECPRQKHHFGITRIWYFWERMTLFQFAGCKIYRRLYQMDNLQFISCLPAYFAGVRPPLRPVVCISRFWYESLFGWNA